MTDTARPRLAALTSARFFAAFHVLLFHMWAMKGLTRAPAWFQTFATTGYVAVTFFFVLSGFILVYTYSGKDLDLQQFWRTRLARLYPVYLFSLLLSAPLFFYAVLKMNIPELAWFKQHPGPTAALVLTMLQAWVPRAALGWNGVNWAVSVEIFFYAVFPLLLARFSRISNQGLGLIGLGCWLVSLASTTAYVVVSPDHIVASPTRDTFFWLNALKFHPLARLPEFVIGLGSGYWFLRGGHNVKLASPLVFGGTAAALATIAFSSHIPYPVMHTGLLTPAFAAIICGLALRPRWISFLENKWFVLLGDSSYSLYLLHALILGTILYLGRPQPSVPTTSRLVVAAVTAMLVAVLTFRFVEEPARKRLRGKARAKATATAVSA